MSGPNAGGGGYGGQYGNYTGQPNSGGQHAFAGGSPNFFGGQGVPSLSLGGHGITGGMMQAQGQQAVNPFASMPAVPTQGGSLGQMPQRPSPLMPNGMNGMGSLIGGVAGASMGPGPVPRIQPDMRGNPWGAGGPMRNGVARAY